MPATRLLVVADPKMLSALASGLRVGGKFEVQTAEFTEPDALIASAAEAEVVALFYGSRQRTLFQVLQELEDPVRGRGARLVAVLQRDQAPQRDECFRAGASDLFFMPMPKDVFVNRLAECSLLELADEEGARASVSVTMRGRGSQSIAGKVTARGVLAPSGPALLPGETVQLSWGGPPSPFVRWGLVVESGDSGLKIRFAGASVEEDSRLQAWLRDPAAQAASAAVTPSMPSMPRPPSMPVMLAASGATGPGTGATSPEVAASASAVAMPDAKIAAGPPPGFAARPPIRPQSLKPAPSSSPRLSTPAKPVSLDDLSLGARPLVSDPALRAARITPSTPPLGNAIIPDAPASAEIAELKPAPVSDLSSLFDDPIDEQAPGIAPELAPLPVWPTPLVPAVAKELIEQILRERDLPADAPAETATAVRKVFDTLPSADREALELAGPDSHLHEALTARVLLVHANAEGTALTSQGAGALVDDAGFTDLIAAANQAVNRLQAEADGAIAKGELERLQQVTAASASLSRELLAFKETADLLRGLAAAPRMGAGGLDPDVVLEQSRRSVSRRGKEKLEDRAEQRRLQLSDFAGITDTPRAKTQLRLLAAGIAVLIAAVSYVFLFALPSVHQASQPFIERAGSGVLRISLSRTNAIVTVAPTWLNAPDRKPRLRLLCDVLRLRSIDRAAVFVEDRGVAGQLDARNCEPIGLPAPIAPKLDAEPPQQPK